jgi:hypothetical protein
MEVSCVANYYKYGIKNGTNYFALVLDFWDTLCIGQHSYNTAENVFPTPLSSNVGTQISKAFVNRAVTDKIGAFYRG